jgi:hypothetical protein
MKKRIIMEICFIFIIGGIGWYLFDAMVEAETNSPAMKLVESDNNLVFMDGAGIDIMGNIVNHYSSEKDETEKYIIAFLLRYGNLNDDLKFWNEVGDYLTKTNTAKLVAYCDSEQCIEIIKKNPLQNSFQVLEYGEIADMQAIINADANGEFWLVNPKGESIKLNWRDKILTPTEIARSINQ